ncbi:MAG: diguanylate phosphodiesterase [Geobacteraceae bacterium GWC2_53_11]|nr:MAG: diguanylate phosphodiesterase [Geobacteraceae bacterium GWC2_53_11]
MKDSSYLIGRQPILDRLEKITFYELLFRSQESPGSANIKSSLQATSQVVVNSLSGFKIEDVLGTYCGLINVDGEMLMSDSIELLPAGVLGLELLNSIEFTPEVITRCRELKSLGYVLALDDHVYSSEYEELYKGIIDIIKIDLIKTPLERVYQTVDSLKRYPLKLLAENVETRHVYLRSRSMGFELFQGFFFSRPSTLQKKKISDSTHTFFKLMQQLIDDSDIAKIERTFKLSPALTYKLLLLVNSVSVGRREKIRTVTHAITLLGLEQLKRWVQLALFANDDSQELDNPLMDMVAVRAAFLEKLALLHPGTCTLPDAPAEAFMVGTLSLLGDCFGFTIDEMIEGLNLSEEIQNALVRREGALGELLTIAELIERLELDEATKLLNQAGIPLIKVLGCQSKAFGWRDAFC